MANLSGHNLRIFDNIEKEVVAAVERTSKKFSERFKYVLLHRITLPGNHGRYPKGLPKGGSRSTEGHSSRAWEVKKSPTVPHAWNIVNNHVNKNDDFNYPISLLSGNQWGPNVENAKHRDRSRKVNGKIFSTQMPNGILPVMKVQHERLKDAISLSIEVAKNELGLR